MTQRAIDSFATTGDLPRRVLWTFVLLALFTVSNGLTGMRATAMMADEPGADTIARCKADLAQRCTLQTKEITVVETRATTWPDAALGMPEMDKMYAQVQTPGWKIILEARHAQYLYTASAKAIKYGGPVAIWSSSMLYIQPVPDEPNLNGDLYQCSLLGTNCRRLVSGVSAYYPQADGVVLFTRRTSRSSFDLLMINAQTPEKTDKLYAAFAVGEAAMNAAQDTWAAYIRPGLGATWQIIVGRISQDNAKPQTLPLPDGVQPGQIAWSGDRLMILVKQGESTACYATTPSADTPVWTAEAAYMFPCLKSYSLNKSETLEITGVETDGKPSVEVAGVWFTGDRKVMATINGLTLRGYDLLTLREYDYQPGRYLLIWGEQDGQSATYIVDIATGKAIPGYRGAGQDIKPFHYAPISAPYRIVMGE